jgi:hypothetical protein
VYVSVRVENPDQSYSRTSLVRMLPTDVGGDGWIDSAFAGPSNGRTWRCGSERGHIGRGQGVLSSGATPRSALGVSLWHRFLPRLQRLSR